MSAASLLVDVGKAAHREAASYVYDSLGQSDVLPDGDAGGTAADQLVRAHTLDDPSAAYIYDDRSRLARASARPGAYRLAPNTATRLTNGAQFETLSSQPISGVTRSAHRAGANKQLFSQLEADPALRQFYDDALGTDVMVHMRSGRSGLRNPPGTHWHHPIGDPNSLLLLRTEVHRHPLLQHILHPRGGGGWAEFYGGGM